MSLDLLNPGWVGSIIGLIGVALAIFFFMRGRIIKKLSYQLRNEHLIGGKKAQLPQEVKVSFNGINVPLLVKTTIIIWNDGTTTIGGSDIVVNDPLRIEFPDDCEILEAKITKITREVLSFEVNKQAPSIINCGFDFLDPHDGARIEVLHTSGQQKVEINGTLRGLPKGLTNLGKLPLNYANKRRVKDYLDLNHPSDVIAQVFLFMGNKTILYSFMVVVGFCMLLMGIFSVELLAAFPALGATSEPIFTPGKSSQPLIIAGFVYSIPPLLLMWMERKRFPSGLAD